MRNRFLTRIESETLFLFFVVNLRGKSIPLGTTGDDNDDDEDDDDDNENVN